MLVMRIYAHEGFNRFTLQNNIAVLRVSERFLDHWSSGAYVSLLSLR